MLRQIIHLSKDSLLKSKIEKLESEDLFFSECYKKAYKLLNDIYINSDISDDNDDDYNNIIAFLGDRGSGKTSTMRSFCYSLKDININNTYKYIDDKQYNIFDKVQFSVLDIIDPSLFTNRDSLVEIIVSNMFKTFKESNNIEIIHKHTLVKQFEKVFREIKTVNLDKKAIFHECNDDVERFIYLSAALDLKKDLKQLINLYLKYLCEDNECNNKKQFLVVPVDDLDMNLEVGGNLLEDIRKYLIQSNVILLIAANFEQLEEIVVQKFAVGLRENLKFQHDVYEIQKNFQEYSPLIDFKNKLDEKTEKYLDKLIPYNRRCFMPHVGSKVTIKIDSDCLKNLNQKSNNLWELIQNELEDKLGYKLQTENHKRTLIPKNLRALIQLLILLNSMKNESNKDIINNLRQMRIYFREVVINEVENKKDRDFLKDLLKCYFKDINRKALIYLNDKILEEFNNSEMDLEDINDNLKYVNDNKTIIFSNRINLGDIVTWIKLYDRIQFENRKSRFIETFKGVYTLRLLFAYYNQSNGDINQDILGDCIGNDFIGKYFYITENRNKNKFFYRIKTSNIEQEDIKKLEEIYPYIIKPRFENEDKKVKNSFYVRLIRREDKRYNTFYDMKNFTKCFFTPLGILEYYAYNELDNLLRIINIDNFINMLDQCDKKLHKLQGNEEEIINKAYEVMFINDDGVFKSLINDDIEIIKFMGSFITNNLKKLKDNIDRKLLKETNSEISKRLDYIQGKENGELFSIKTLKQTCRIISEKLNKIGLGKTEIDKFQNEITEVSNRLNGRTNKDNANIKKYINVLKEIQETLNNLVEE